MEDRAAVCSLPLNAFAPLQPPLASHEVALLEDQLRVAVPPLATEAGLAPSETVGGTDPEPPVQGEGRDEFTQAGLWPLPDLSEMSLGVGFTFRYQMLAPPAEVVMGSLDSMSRSGSDSEAL